MARKPKTKSYRVKHRQGDELARVSRVFDEGHVAAGYHEQEFGEAPHADHDVVGEHATPRGTIRVEFTDGEPVFRGALHVGGSWTGGPEFKVTMPDGSSVQVLDVETVQAYLAQAWR